MRDKQLFIAKVDLKTLQEFQAKSQLIEDWYWIKGGLIHGLNRVTC